MALNASHKTCGRLWHKEAVQEKGLPLSSFMCPGNVACAGTMKQGSCQSSSASWRCLPSRSLRGSRALLTPRLQPIQQICKSTEQQRQPCALQWPKSALVEAYDPNHPTSPHLTSPTQPSGSWNQRLLNPSELDAQLKSAPLRVCLTRIDPHGNCSASSPTKPHHSRVLEVGDWGSVGQRGPPMLGRGWRMVLWGRYTQVVWQPGGGRGLGHGGVGPRGCGEAGVVVVEISMSWDICLCIYINRPANSKLTRGEKTADLRGEGTRR